MHFLTSSSHRGNSSRNETAKDFTESRSARSSLRTRTLPLSANGDLPEEEEEEEEEELHCARCASMSLLAASPRSMDLQASTTVAPFSAMRLAVSRPIPVFDPVTMVTWEGAFCTGCGRHDDGSGGGGRGGEDDDGDIQ